MRLFGLESTQTNDYGSRSGLIGANQGDELGISPLRLPYGVTSVKQPVSHAGYNNRYYIAGGYSYQLVIDENMTVWKQGMLPPVEGPTISGAASGGTGNVAFLSWYDEYTGERSTLGPGTTIGSGERIWQDLPGKPPDDVHISEGTLTFEDTPLSGDAGFFWTDDPRTRTFYLRPGDAVTFADPSLYTDVVSTVLSNRIIETYRGYDLFGGPGSGDKTVTMAAEPFSRATHLELWVSDSGGLPRLATRVPIGTTTHTESTSTQNLGETFSDTFQKFPFCSINAIYHDRQLLAGDPDNADTLYVSELFFPERYGGLSFKTRNGEKIVSIIATRDYALVMTDRSSYILQGYTDNDLTFTVADPNIGAITHVGNTVVHGTPYVWTDAGPYLYNGAWHPVSPENKYYLRECLHQEESAIYTYRTPDLFRDLGWEPHMRQPEEQFRFWQGSRDPNWNCWITGGTVVLDYTPVQPQAGGAFQPGRLALDLFNAPTADSAWFASPVHPEVAAWVQDRFEAKGALWMGHDSIFNGGTDDYLYFSRLDDSPVEVNTDFYLEYTYEVPNGAGGFVLSDVAAPFMPFDFTVILPYHGNQDSDSGAYERAGRVYRQIWLHAQQEGSDTRFWFNDPTENETNPNVWSLDVKQYSILNLYPGEETSINVLSGPAATGFGTDGVQTIDITESLSSRGLLPIGTTVVGLAGGTLPPDEGDQGGKQGAIHGTPPLTGITGRGLNVAIRSQWTGSKIRILGYGGLYGAGPHNIYGVVPWA